MLIIMSPEATEEQIRSTSERAQGYGMRVIENRGATQVVLALIGDETEKIPHPDVFVSLPGVQEVKRVQVPYRLASRQMHHHNSVIEIQPGLTIGAEDNELVVMSGPCSVESEEGIMVTAKAVKAAGARILRGGAYKPRTAPRTFEGLGRQGLELLAAAKQETGLAIVTELMDIRELEPLCAVADIVQIGARNMQNYSLLNELGRIDNPILLQRGMSATIEEWLLAAERIMHHGNHRVILCERGIRSFDAKFTRNVLDLAAVTVVKHLSHLPVIADPSHGTGKSGWVRNLALASLFAGADGLMIETHPDPANALSDGPQSLRFEQFEELMVELRTAHDLALQLKVGRV